MVHFIGAGPGAEDLITVRGAKLLGEADVIIYAGSLVNPALLNYKKESCAVYDSASMTLEQVIEVMKDTEARGGMTVRLHTGDPSLYGAIREQMDELDKLGVGYDVTPGVSSFSGAAAALCAEYTLPEVSQSVIITRMAGRTPVPEGEELRKMAEAPDLAIDMDALTAEAVRMFRGEALGKMVAEMAGTIRTGANTSTISDPLPMKAE